MHRHRNLAGEQHYKEPQGVDMKVLLGYYWRPMQMSMYRYRGLEGEQHYKQRQGMDMKMLLSYSCGLGQIAMQLGE
jgi:hypothetical protein